MSEKYNGWNNYETWNAALWINNDQALQESATERVTDNRHDTADAADALSTIFEDYEMIPDLPSGPASDMLNASLSAIDWYEIAQSFITDLDPEEDEDED